jgi:AraC-like DNA-binding protein
MHEQQEMLCDLWPEEQVERKPHSRLYSLEPIGIGSPIVESMTSYIVRLAVEHSVYPRALITDGIAPLLKQPSLYQNGHIVYDYLTAYWKSSSTLNGITNQTRDMVQALEQLTLRYNLHVLTMLSWQYVLSPRKLLRRRRAWCPICYQEWRDKNEILYEPLLWSIEVINVCHRHCLRLQTYCPNAKCNQAQLPLSPHAQPGYCSRCHSWLGNLPKGEAEKSLISEDQEGEWQLWTAQAVGDLLSAAPALSEGPRREQIPSTIDMYAEKLTRGQRKTLIRLLGCNYSTVQGWFYNKEKPQLSHLLYLCFRLGASPIHLLLGEIEEAAVAKHTSLDRPKGHYRKFDDERIRQILEAILRSEDTSLSMEEVARQQGYHPWQIFERFPELCRAISAKHMASPIFTRRVQVTAGAASSIPLEQRFRRFDRERAQHALEAALQVTAEAPPSMKAVARNLGCSPNRVRKHFPELCRAVSKQYKEAQATKRMQRVQSLRREVRDVVLTIHQQGRYPSMRQVAKHLNNSGVLREPEVKAAWREAVQELGWK